MVVPEGASCYLASMVVTGQVVVKAGAHLILEYTEVWGNVEAAGHRDLNIVFSEVHGNVETSGGGEAPLVAANTVYDSWVGSNVVGGSLTCVGNDPPPINDGDLNDVVGAKRGQCADL